MRSIVASPHSSAATASSRTYALPAGAAPYAAASASGRRRHPSTAPDDRSRGFVSDAAHDALLPRKTTSAPQTPMSAADSAGPRGALALRRVVTTRYARCDVSNASTTAAERAPRRAGRGSAVGSGGGGEGMVAGARS